MPKELCDICEDKQARVKLALTNMEGELQEQLALCEDCAPIMHVDRTLRSLSY